MELSQKKTAMDPEYLNKEDESTGAGIKVFKYRWVVLLIFCLCTITNFMQFLQFTIIANVLTKFYGVDNLLIDATGLIFFVTYILLFLPVSYLIEKYSLKTTLMVSSGLTMIGTLIKIGSANPDRYYVVMIGQTFCALAQIYLLSIPSKFACVWFGANQVSTACAIAVLGTQLGAAIGAVLPPFTIKGDNNDEIGDNLYYFLIFNAVIACVVFIIVAAFFRSKPLLPPSQSQRQLLEVGEEPPPFFENCKTLVKNRNFVLLLISYGIFNSLWNSFGILINTIYTHYFPDGESDVGLITLSAIISGGCIGSVVFGLILDKTHLFKKISVGIMVISSILYIVVVYCLMAKARVGVFVAVPIFGFFIASGLLISFEYTIELTYPIPESVSCSVMNATIFLFAIIYSLIGEVLISTVGYLSTYITSLIVFLFCAITLLFVKTDLRRREANIASSQSDVASDFG